jgi:hypothetical protein
MRTRTSSVVRRIAVVAAGACLVLPAGAASGARLVASGHDSDHHCGRAAPNEREQCHFFRTALDYVRGGAPDPTKPVLVLDRAYLDVPASLDRIYGPNAVPRTVVDPRSSAFMVAPISTELYSAVVIASSRSDRPEDKTQQDLNELNSTPDSDAINARAGDLRDFFDSGGGIFVNAGNAHGDGPGDPYYGFLPITVQSARVTNPFTLTDAGRALGFVDRDVTCCPTHNTFEQPSPFSALRAVDTDAVGRRVTLFAEAPTFSSLGEPPISPGTLQQVARGVASAKRCRRRRSVRIRLHRPRHRRFSTAVVYVNGKRARRFQGRRITRPFRVRLRGNRTRVRIVILTTGKKKLTIRRTYRRCKPRHHRRHRRHAKHRARHRRH